ncbi:MAG: hypothetical protein C5B52_06465 [Bacteroidetes bacterium]|nr:MAG: hypothetical protein C5B52_06465 [Bacteroidota bacterium]
MKFGFIKAFILLVYLGPVQLLAQAPNIEWQKCYGGTYGENASSVEQTSDGGYIVAGWSDSRDYDVSSNHGKNDFWVLKLNSAGVIQWQKAYGGSGNDEARVIHQSSDGGFLIAGGSDSKNDGDVTSSHMGFDFWLVKTGSSGNILWQKTYGGSGNDYAYTMRQTPDNGYVIAGYSESADGDATVNHGLKDFWIIKLNSIGIIQWQKSYGGSKDDIAYSIQNTMDGGYVVAGKTESNDGDASGNHGGSDFWVIKLDGSGALKWQKVLGGSKEDSAQSIQQTSDGGFIIAGTTNSNDFDVSGLHGVPSDAWLVKLSATGNLEWQECLGGTSTEGAYEIETNSDGTNIICGYSKSLDGAYACNLGVEDFWIVKTNPNGKILWQRTIGGNHFDEAHSVKATGDGGFIMVGLTYSTTIPGYHPGLGNDAGDDWIVKLATPPTPVAQPVVSIFPDSPSICAGTAINFSSSSYFQGTHSTISWTRNGITVATGASYAANDFAVNDTIICVLTTETTCTLTSLTSSDTVVIRNNTFYQPSITISTNSTSICNGAPVEFDAITGTIGNSVPYYQWTINGNAVGSNSAQFSSNSIKNGDIINCNYSLNPVPACYTIGNSVSNNLVMNVSNYSVPGIDISLSANNVCAGTPITASVSAQNGGSNPSFEWFVNLVDVGNSDNLLSDQFKNGDEIFCVMSPGSNACSTTQVYSDTLSLSILDSPQILLTPADTTIFSGSQLQLNASLSPDVNTFQWSPSNMLLDANIISPTTKNLDADIDFTLSATSQNGCTSFAETKVKVLKSIYIPNAFTPNGDGLNDIFRIPPGVAFNLSAFNVYDRWGLRIFSSRDINNGWDGKIQGKPAAPGIYVYTISGSDNKGAINLRGIVTLIR